MKKVVHFEVHFVILYSKTELLSVIIVAFFMVWCTTLFVVWRWHGLPSFTEGWGIFMKQTIGCDLLFLIVMK